MPCCEPFIVSFANASSTTISYSAAKRALYGDYPRVEVFYYDEDTGEYYVSQITTAIRMRGTPVNEIFVDHGGDGFNGKIKIS